MFSKSAGDNFKTVSSFARERKQPRARTQVSTIIVEKLNFPNPIVSYENDTLQECKGALTSRLWSVMVLV